MGYSLPAVACISQVLHSQMSLLGAGRSQCFALAADVRPSSPRRARRRPSPDLVSLAIAAMTESRCRNRLVAYTAFFHMLALRNFCVKGATQNLNGVRSRAFLI